MRGAFFYRLHTPGDMKTSGEKKIFYCLLRAFLTPFVFRNFIRINTASRPVNFHPESPLND
jgi:hypothetical protein